MITDKEKEFDYYAKIVIIVITIIGCICTILSNITSDITIKVTGFKKVMSKPRYYNEKPKVEKLYIYTEDEIFKCENDLLFHGLTQNEYIFNTMKKGKTYNVEVKGFRPNRTIVNLLK